MEREYQRYTLSENPVIVSVYASFGQMGSGSERNWGSISRSYPPEDGSVKTVYACRDAHVTFSKTQASFYRATTSSVAAITYADVVLRYSNDYERTITCPTTHDHDSYYYYGNWSVSTDSYPMNIEHEGWVDCE